MPHHFCNRRRSARRTRLRSSAPSLKTVCQITSSSRCSSSLKLSAAIDTPPHPPVENVRAAIGSRGPTQAFCRRGEADRTLAQRIRYFADFDLLIRRRVRLRSPRATWGPGCGQPIIRGDRRTHAKACDGAGSNVDFGTWGEYLGDPPLPTANGPHRRRCLPHQD